MNLGFHNNTISERYTRHAIPMAISSMLADKYQTANSDKRPKQERYTAFSRIAGIFIHHPGTTNELINRAMSQQQQQEDSLFFISGDDKGLVDYTKFAFTVFKPRQASLYHAFFLILTLTSLIYALAFFKSTQKMLLLTTILISLYACLYTFSITDQANNIMEPRFLGMLSIIPLIHMLNIITAPSPATRYNFLYTLALASAQVFLLIFIYHARTSELWQFLTIGCITFFTIISILYKKAKTTKPHKNLSLAFVMLPLIMLIIGLCCLHVYKSKYYHPDYFSKYLSARVTWHNALMGLAVDPYIAKQYNLQLLSDETAAKAVKEHLIKKGDTKSLEEIFSNPNYSQGNFYNFNWAAYELKAKDLYLDIFKQHYLKVLKIYFIEMPKVFLESSLFLADKNAIFNGSRCIVGSVINKEQRSSMDLYLKPLRKEIIALILIISILSIRVRDWNFKLDLKNEFLFVTMALISFIPGALVLPTIQYMQLSLVVILAAFYYALILACNFAINSFYSLKSRGQLLSITPF